MSALAKEPSSFDSHNDFEVLGLTESATEEDIKRAFRALSLKHHPDKWSQAPPAVRQVQEEIFKKISAAHDRIQRGQARFAGSSGRSGAKPEPDQSEIDRLNAMFEEIYRAERQPTARALAKTLERYRMTHPGHGAQHLENVIAFVRSYSDPLSRTKSSTFEDFLMLEREMAQLGVKYGFELNFFAKGMPGTERAGAVNVYSQLKANWTRYRRAEGEGPIQAFASASTKWFGHADHPEYARDVFNPYAAEAVREFLQRDLAALTPPLALDDVSARQIAQVMDESKFALEWKNLVKAHRWGGTTSDPLFRILLLSDPSKLDEVWALMEDLDGYPGTVQRLERMLATAIENAGHFGTDRGREWALLQLSERMRPEDASRFLQKLRTAPIKDPKWKGEVKNRMNLNPCSPARKPGLLRRILGAIGKSA